MTDRSPAAAASAKAAAHAATAAPGTGTGESSPLSPAGVRGLKILIFVMTALIVIALLVIIVRMVQLASRPKPGDAARVVANPVNTGRLSLPAGAVVRHIALDGGRIAVHYDSPTGAGIRVVDLATGAVVMDLAIEPGVPTR